jgi:hypothetical protein
MKIFVEAQESTELVSSEARHANSWNLSSCLTEDTLCLVKLLSSRILRHVSYWRFTGLYCLRLQSKFIHVFWRWIPQGLMKRRFLLPGDVVWRPGIFACLFHITITYLSIKNFVYRQEIAVSALTSDLAAVVMNSSDVIFIDTRHVSHLSLPFMLDWMTTQQDILTLELVPCVVLASTACNNILQRILDFLYFFFRFFFARLFVNL